MKKYCGRLDGAEVPTEVLDLADRTTAKYEVVERIVDISKNHEGLWLRLQWEGLPEERDYTWATLDDMYAEIPEMVITFLRASGKKKLAALAARHLDISL